MRNSIKKGEVLNPTGKGGFQDHPELRANGRWSKDGSISYWYNYLIRLSVAEFNKFKPETKAQELAYKSVKESASKLQYLKEVTDRTEGKPETFSDITSGGEKLPSQLNISVTDQQAKEILQKRTDANN